MSLAQQLQKIYSDLEQACVHFNNHPSESNALQIASFKNLGSYHVATNLTNVMILTQYVLQHSKNQMVVFHGIKNLREFILENWDLVQAEEVLGVLKFLLQYLVFNSMMNYTIKNQVLLSIATVYKRGCYLEVIQKSLLGQVEEMLTSQDLRIRENGFLMCCILSLEFSLEPTMKLPWEFNKNAKDFFQNRCLQPIFAHSLTTINQIIHSPPEIKNSTIKLMEYCLENCEKIVYWKFNDSTTKSQFFNPGASWRPLFQNTQVVQLFFKLFMEYKNEDAILTVISTILSQLASISSEVFPSTTTQEEYAQFFLQGLLHFVSLAREKVTPCYIRNLARVIFKLITEQNISSSVLVEGLTWFTCHVFSEMKKVKSDETLLEDAVNILLDTWMWIVSDEKSASILQENGFIIFQQYTETRLFLAKKELEEIADGSIQPKDYISYMDQLTNIANLARSALIKSTNLLIQLLNVRLNSFKQVINTGIASSKHFELLEEIHWLILIIGFFLADNVDSGEDPAIPKPIMDYKFSLTTQNDVINELIHIFFNLLEIENAVIDKSLFDYWSPLIAETNMWFLQRWCLSYLDNSPEKKYPNPAFNDGKIIDFIILKIGRNLLSWTEVDIAKMTCEVLVSLSKIKLISDDFLKCKAWQDLLNLHFSNDQRITELPGSVQRKFIRGLVGFKVGTLQQQYFMEMIKPIKDALSSILNHPDFQKKFEHPHITKALIEQLERCRGVVKSTAFFNWELVWSFISCFLTSFVGIVKIYKHFPVLILTLKLWADISEYMLFALSNDKKEIFIQQSMEFIIAFKNSSKENPHQKSKDIYHEEMRDQLIQILRVIQEISKDSHPTSGSTAFTGLAITLEFLTPDLLLFQNLENLFFSTQSYLFEYHSDKFVILPNEILQNILKGLNLIFLPKPYTSSVTKDAFDSLLFLLSHYFNILYTEKRNILANHKQFINPFIPKLIEYCSKYTPSSLIPLVADLYFALFCFDMQEYEQQVVKFISLVSTKENNLAAILPNLFKSLHQSIEPQFQPTSRNQFCKNFEVFLPIFRTSTMFIK
eukprot:TRINITY_DN12176_c0_g1_i1.p1 TRINITY_DN12176_c0_g1~~TRINITY_DN12176_c0_g1_i1.p1  ORF type:complete len:1064 (-),score=262.93 TRINITY_DN12176_c0_g1_i1:71-3229(-)